MWLEYWVCLCMRSSKELIEVEHSHNKQKSMMVHLAIKEKEYSEEQIKCFVCYNAPLQDASDAMPKYPCSTYNPP